MPGEGLSDHIVSSLDEMLEKRGMTLVELSAQVGVTVANLSILKNNRARAIRFSTLAVICQVLQCDVSDLFHYEDAPSQAAGQ